MTLRLILIRHAKSDWNDAGLEDFERPLNDRGRSAAPRIGAWLATRGYRPDTVLCSAARRTQETWALIAGELPDPPDPILSRGLYLARPQDLLTAIRGAEGGTLALVGHNPGIGSLARSLAANPPEHVKFGQYPTGATTVYEYPEDTWPAVSPGHGKVVDFVVPKELPGAD